MSVNFKRKKTKKCLVLRYFFKSKTQVNNFEKSSLLFQDAIHFDLSHLAKFTYSMTKVILSKTGPGILLAFKALIKRPTLFLYVALNSLELL